MKKKSKKLNRCDINNIAFKIHGYITADYPFMPKKDKFLMAKEEIIKDINREIDMIDQLTFKQYENAKGRDFR